MKRGFSLVELAIVLVILGLLTGGILAGQSLIRAAELRAVTTEHSRYVTAVSAFRDKYFALPGDMTNAISFWGAAGSCPGTDATPSTTATTCNGNGDGLIANSTSREHFRFWQHLANAGLIEGTYSGVEAVTATSSLTVSSVNSPKSKLGTGLWFVYNYATINGNGSLFDGTYGNVFEMGAPYSPGQAVSPVVKPEEIWNIDTKIDDGRPGAGKIVVRALNGLNTCTDTSTTTNYAAAYLLSSNIVNCSFNFRQQF